MSLSRVSDPLTPFCSRPHQLSTYALTLYKHTATVGNKTVAVGVYCAAFFPPTVTPKGNFVVTETV